MKEKFFEGLENLGKLKEKIPKSKLATNADYAILLEITKALSSILDLSLLLEKVVDKVLEITQAERGFLMLFNDEGRLEFRVARNSYQQTLTGETFKISNSIIGRVLKRGQGLFLEDVSKDKYLSKQSSIAELDLHTVMCVPLKVGGEKKPNTKKKKPVTKPEIIGVIYVDSKLVTKSFKQNDLNLLEALASQAAIAIQNARLFTLATIDKKTGLYQHHYFQKRLDEEFRKSQRYLSSLSLIMIDIDHFKKINDRYGHIVGDRVLAEIGELIKKNVRVIDLPARYGGEEFAVILPQTSAKLAISVAERLRRSIAARTFVDVVKPGMLTVSIGVASSRPEHTKTRIELIEAADKALYISKQEGRNRTTHFRNTSKSAKEEEAPVNISNLFVDDKELRILYKVSQSLNIIRDATKLFDQIMDLAIETIGAERGFLVLRDPQSFELEVKVARNIKHDTILETKEIFESIVDIVIKEGKPFLSRDARVDDRLKKKKSSVLHNIVSLVCVPLCSVSGIAGAIYFDDRNEVGRFSQQDLEFLVAFANLAMIAIENTRYRESLKKK